MMSRAAMMLGTAAFAAAQAENHPFNKWTVSAVNFTVSVNKDVAEFDSLAQSAFSGAVLDRIVEQNVRFGMEIYDVEAHPTRLSHSQFNARFYSSAKGDDEKPLVEDVAKNFYYLSNEARWEEYEEEQYKKWEVKNEAAKEWELKTRKVYNPTEPFPEMPAIVDDVAATVVDENAGLHTQYPELIFAEIDCKRTNYDEKDLPEWAKVVDFDSPRFHAQCHDDDALSSMTVIGLFCGGWVVFGVFIFAFILLCAGSGKATKAAPAEEPTY